MTLIAIPFLLIIYAVGAVSLSVGFAGMKRDWDLNRRGDRSYWLTAGSGLFIHAFLIFLIIQVYS